MNKLILCFIFLSEIHQYSSSMYSCIVANMKYCEWKYSSFIVTINFPHLLNFIIITLMNSWSNTTYDIPTKSTQLNKQCPHCQSWFTRQKSFKHHIRCCRRANHVEMFNDIGSTAANPILSIITPEVLTTVFEKSYLNQSDKDDYLLLGQL